MCNVYSIMCTVSVFSTEYEEDSEEESGKDWDQLEKKQIGREMYNYFLSIIRLLLN